MKQFTWDTEAKSIGTSTFYEQHLNDVYVFVCARVGMCVFAMCAYEAKSSDVGWHILAQAVKSKRYQLILVISLMDFSIKCMA